MKYLLLTLSSLLFLITSCNKSIVGSGAIVTQNFNVNKFRSISSETSIDINVAYGEEQSVKVSGYENLMEHIVFSVNSERLKIDLKNGNYSNLNLEVEIVLPVLDKLKVNSSGSIAVGSFNLENLELQIESSGSIRTYGTFEIQNKLTAKLNSSGSISVDGFANKQEISMDGPGSFRGYGMSSNSCNIKMDGSGNIKVLVNDTLNAEINGSGNVYYKGNPQIFKDLDGSGDAFNDN